MLRPGRRKGELIRLRVHASVQCPACGKSGLAGKGHGLERSQKFLILDAGACGKKPVVDPSVGIRRKNGAFSAGAEHKVVLFAQGAQVGLTDWTGAAEFDA